MLRTTKVAEHLEVASVVEGVANGLVRFEVGHSQILEVMAKNAMHPPKVQRPVALNQGVDQGKVT